MQLQDNTLVYLPLTRRAGLVRAFAALVRALPPQAERPGAQDVPAYLRRDLGLPHEAAGRGSAGPPVSGRSLLL